MPFGQRQIGLTALFHRFHGLAQRLPALPAEARDHAFCWAVAAFAAGIAEWFVLPGPDYWLAFMIAMPGLALLTIASGGSWSRLGMAARAMIWGALLMAAGCGWIWLHAETAATPTLAVPYYGTVEARILSREPIPARDQVRFVLAPRPAKGLPPRVRVNLKADADRAELVPGATIKASMRLMPPAQAALPGGYSFARRAWFEGWGGSGSVIGPVALVRAAPPRLLTFSRWRERLSAHIRDRIDGPGGAVAATLATGDRGAIPDADSEAMRASGLAHLLSISGLHVSAVIAAALLATRYGLALSPALARRWRLPLIAAGVAALAGIGYTLLTGAEVPTLRACIAALFVLLALAIGRDPISMRLVAAGALIVLLIWPEALAGPSFQMSFAAVVAIVALHDHPAMRRWAGARDLGLLGGAGRFVGMLFVTGLLIEAMLMPIALFHFHQTGLYGALANIVAIPLTTFVIMPLEALALLLDPIGLGAPAWWLCGQALQLLLALAHGVAGMPGALLSAPAIGRPAFGLFVLGALWLALWRGRLRYAGLVSVALAVLLIATAPIPDLFVSGDGRHVAIRTADARLLLLRAKPGSFGETMLREAAGYHARPMPLEISPDARCSKDFCTLVLGSRGDQRRTLLVGRSRLRVPERALAAACRRVDIVIADRYLPASCRPRWLKVDRALLDGTGGLAIATSGRSIASVADAERGHPWFERAKAPRRSGGPRLVAQ